MKSIKQIKIFVSCPNDIKEEIDSIQLVVNDINKTSGRQNGYVLEILNWKYDTYTDIGSDAQEVINDQLEDQYDILVAILWTKAGTPTKRDKSGTIEEVNRAIANNSKEQLIYFRTSPLENIYQLDLNQFALLKNFKGDLSLKGVLYKEYDSIDSFESLFRINITNLIIDKVLNESKKNDITVLPITSEKYADIYNLIFEVESKNEAYYDIDIFMLIDDATSYLNNVTFSLTSLTQSISFLGEIMKKRTTEINKYNLIKDTALKKSKVMNSINHLADEILEFNKRVDEELPSYSENFKLTGKAYSQILLSSSKDSPDIIDLKLSIQTLRDQVKYSVDEGANLLKTIINLPLINSKFNKSKRLTEITIKNIIKETLDGLLLLDELLEN